MHSTAIIGDPPESRDFEGPGIPPLISPNARINAFVTVDAGTVAPTKVGRAFIMAHCHVGHDATIGNDVELAPHVIIGGFATVEDNVRIGMGAIIRNRVRVGCGARIGMGAVVTKDVPAGEVWVGSPAHNIEVDPRIDPLWFELYGR